MLLHLRDRCPLDPPLFLKGSSDPLNPPPNSKGKESGQGQARGSDQERPGWEAGV